MAITFTNDSATIGATEYSFPGDAAGPTSQTTDGVFEFFVDVSNVTAGDSFRFRLYEKYDSTGTQRLAEEWIISGAQSKPMFITPGFVLGEGWDFTAQRIAGSDRTIYWSIRKIA